MTERMALSHLRDRICAGTYHDDLYTDEERRLLFLRWLIRQSHISEQEVLHEASEEHRHPALDESSAPELGTTRFRSWPVTTWSETPES
jgi:hypothetical protein